MTSDQVRTFHEMAGAGAAAREIAAALGVRKTQVYVFASRVGVRLRPRPKPPRLTAEQWGLIADPDNLRALTFAAAAATPRHLRRFPDRVEESRDMLMDRMIRAAGRWRPRTPGERFVSYWRHFAVVNCRSEWARRAAKAPPTVPLTVSDRDTGAAAERPELGRPDAAPEAVACAAEVLGAVGRRDAELLRDFFGIGRRPLTSREMAAARGLRSRRAVEVRVAKVIGRLREKLNRGGLA